MELKNLSTVVLLRDIPEEGLKQGDLGAVVEVYDSGKVEVEFVTAAGHTKALLTLENAHVRLADDSDIPAVRSPDAA